MRKGFAPIAASDEAAGRNQDWRRLYLQEEDKEAKTHRQQILYFLAKM